MKENHLAHGIRLRRNISCFQKNSVISNLTSMRSKASIQDSLKTNLIGKIRSAMRIRKYAHNAH